MMDSKRGMAIHIEPHTFEKVVCRPGVEWWVQSGLFAAISLFLLVVMLLDEKPLSLVKAVFLLAPLCFSVICAMYSAKTYIVVTPEGLRWSRMQRGGSTHWSEVRDYYRILSGPITQNTSSNTTAYSLQIVTEQGIVRLSSQWRGAAQLQEMVQRFAVAAEVQEWEWQGTRANDPWPRTFRYWDRRSGIALGAASAITAIFIVVAFWCAANKMLAPNVPLMGWEWSLGVTALAMPLLLMPALFPGMVACNYWQRWLRRHQYFTVDREGFTYTDENAITRVAWEEVGDYYTASGNTLSGPCFLIALCGREERNILFTLLLSDVPLLAAIIARYAPCPASRKAVWRVQNGDVRFRTDKGWMHTVAGVEGRIFTYRSPEWRALFGVSLAVIVAVPLIILLERALGLAEMGRPRSVSDAVSALALAGVLMAAWAFIHRCYIRIDDLGITSVTPLGRKSIPWLAVTDYGDKDIPWILGRDGKRIRVGVFLVEKEALREEIQRRAPRPLTGWGEP